MEKTISKVDLTIEGSLFYIGTNGLKKPLTNFGLMVNLKTEGIDEV